MLFLKEIESMSFTDEYVLAAYVEGFDLEIVAPALRAAFERFANSNHWPSAAINIVDQRSPVDPSAPEFLPQWDLGMNLGLEHVSRTPDWFAGIEALVDMLQQLVKETGREFVVFLCFRTKPWRQEHLVFLDAAPVDLEWLRAAIFRLIGQQNENGGID